MLRLAKLAILPQGQSYTEVTLGLSILSLQFCRRLRTKLYQSSQSVTHKDAESLKIIICFIKFEKKLRSFTRRLTVAWK